jgi:hypothetical protein
LHQLLKATPPFHEKPAVYGSSLFEVARENERERNEE